MSADNFFLIRKHPLGGFTAVQGFASDEDEKGHQIMPEARITDRQFGTIKEAREWVEPEYAEYGISIHFECEADFDCNESELREQIAREIEASRNEYNCAKDTYGNWMTTCAHAESAAIARGKK